MKHDRLTEQGQELAALYALGSLTQQEARAFESHLEEGCEICQAEIEKFEQVVGILGSSAPPVAPPASLRSQLESRISKEAQPSLNKVTEAALVIPFPENVKSVRAEIDKSASTSWRLLLPWAVAALLVIALAYSIASWQSERKELRASIDDYKNEAIELRNRLIQKSLRATNELVQINDVLASPQFSMIAMAGQKVAPTSSANVYWDVARRRWVVTADLPPAPAGKVYQLWFVTPDAKVSAGLIEPDEFGHGFAAVNIPENVTKVAAAAITLEPKGGSDQPTMPIYVLGKVG